MTAMRLPCTDAGQLVLGPRFQPTYALRSPAYNLARSLIAIPRRVASVGAAVRTRRIVDFRTDWTYEL